MVGNTEPKNKKISIYFLGSVIDLNIENDYQEFV